MFKEKKVDKLVKAGIISLEQKRQILEFEENKNSDFISKMVNLFGVFVICVGIISVVAANWNYIGDSIKLAVMFALLFGGGVQTCFWQIRGEDNKAEKMLVVLFWLVAAAIGLIIQIYQLSGGEWYSVLALLYLITIPLLFVAKQKYVAFFWTPVFLVWCWASMIDMMSDSVLYNYRFHAYGGEHLIMIAMFGSFVFLAKMMMIYTPHFALGEVLHKDSLWMAYIVFAIYILTSWGRYEIPFIRLLIALGMIVLTSFVYKHYGSYDLIRRNIKYAGLVIVVFYVNVASYLGLLHSGIGLILSGIGLLVLVKYWPKIVDVVTEGKKND